MLFTQIEFLILFALTMAWVLLVRHHGVQKWGLLAVSYYFYGYWDWRFLGLLLFCTAVNYIAASAIVAEAKPGRRKAWLVGAVSISLAVLGFFKYYNFFITSAEALLAPFGVHLGTLRIILPVGISFFTFQTLSYTIDVYRGRIPATRSFRDLALYIAFFPQLVAGPIVRASEFMPQLETPRILSWRRAYEGFAIAVLGFFKKVFIADRVASFVDGVFAAPDVYDGATLALGVLAYAVQIYCDFSGYSDIAIGVARILGYDFSRNFNMPYVARGIDEFWHRWHISLSTWLRDYLYIPLGGSRRGRVSTYMNLLLTMVLGGLWHGAAWTFVAWGAWHGGALAVQRWFHEGSRSRETTASAWWRGAVGWLLTMIVVMVGWVFFRARTFSDAWTMISRIGTLAGGVTWLHPFAVFAVAGLGIHHGLAQWEPLRRTFAPRVDSVWTPALLFSMLWLVVVFYPRGFQPFIYFQF
jgi:alginate O-acetyltransferase complex protein AlgI